MALRLSIYFFSLNIIKQRLDFVKSYAAIARIQDTYGIGGLDYQ